MTLAESSFVSIFKSSSSTQSIVKTNGKFNCGSIADRLTHGNDIIYMLRDRISIRLSQNFAALYYGSVRRSHQLLIPI
ncbi:MAG: hypothetical protein KME31_00945 [Tolypothrix carrinoi HA7290-LM1]|nr:hypothetical protein [Tolypothrix carrinoi HA7290-LM1]